LPCVARRRLRKKDAGLSELEIPKSDQDGLAIWREMPEESLAAFLSEIQESAVTSAIPNLSPDDAKQAVATLKSLYAIRAFSDVSTDTFIDDVCEALIEAHELPLSEEKRLHDRLQRLLDIGHLKTAAKAANLHTEHERLFCYARVLTDARPVYGDIVSAGPEAMIITHELKLTFHEGPRGTLQEIYIGLGSNELAQLQEQLQRAEEKAKNLRETFSSPKIKFLDPPQGE
jgi:hypothetical protein